MNELPEHVSKSALHLTLFAFIIATGYVTLVSKLLTLTQIYCRLIYHLYRYIVFVFTFQASFSATAFCGPVFSPYTVETKFFVAQYFSTLSHGFCSFTI